MSQLQTDIKALIEQGERALKADAYQLLIEWVDELKRFQETQGNAWKDKQPGCLSTTELVSIDESHDEDASLAGPPPSLDDLRRWTRAGVEALKGISPT